MKRLLDSPVAQSLVAGTLFTVATVGIGVLGYKSYGWAMFVIGPLASAIVTGYFANRTGDMGRGRTVGIALMACILGGLALILFALEGLVCLVMASPLALALTIPGALIGRRLANRERRSSPLMCCAIMPLAFLIEANLPHVAAFDTVERIEITAPADAVWQSLLRMDGLDAGRPLAFHLGVAYPVSGKVLGEGVGAMRRAVFSTGVAHERVTEWQPGHRLTLDVLGDVPALKELSPYGDIHTPHVKGYFRMVRTSFALEALPGGHIRLTETTAHELRLDPVPYWLPIARWVIHQNNQRVLEHIRTDAEQRVRVVGLP